jgi:signal recognition particle subunit SRP54
MLKGLTEKFGRVLHYVRGFGKLTEENVAEAARQIRLALLEADVHYSVVRQFVDEVKARALDRKVLSAITPHQLFVTIVHEELLKLLGSDNAPPVLYPDRLNRIVVFGANGSGKTTTCVKLACHYRKLNPLVVALDLSRPAAIDQLEQLCAANKIALFADRTLHDPLKAAALAEPAVADHGCVIYDTAGRFDVDQALMAELKAVVDGLKPDYRLLVADSQEGQKGIERVKVLKERIGIDSVILTKLDSDTRGGLTLSIKHQTGLPVAFMATGEKMGDLEPFSGRMVADRLLSLFSPDINAVQKLQDELSGASLEELTPGGEFDLEQFSKSLSFLSKGNILGSLLKTIPGLPAEASVDTRELQRFKAILSSMTRWERRNPDRIDHKRRLRIARGSGVIVQEVNILMKRFNLMRDMMSKFARGRRGKSGKRGRPGPGDEAAIQELLRQVRRR